MTIVEIKTGSPVSPRDEIQATVQWKLLQENPTMRTPGLVRHNEGDSHWYTLNGVEIPGLTSYLSQLITFPYKDDYNAKRGTWIHEKCADIDGKGISAGRDILDFLANSNHPDREFLGNCISSYVQFKKDYGLQESYVLNEVPLACKSMNVAATLDKIFETSDNKLILLYLGKNYRAIEISPREQRLHLSQFYAVKMFCQLTNWGKPPNDAREIMAQDLDRIIRKQKIRKELQKYIDELRRQT